MIKRSMCNMRVKVMSSKRSKWIKLTKIEDMDKFYKRDTLDNKLIENNIYKNNFKVLKKINVPSQTNRPKSN